MPPIPVVHAFPVRRPNFILSAEWLNQDAQLALKITFRDAGGTLKQLQFATRNLGDGTKGEICLPNSSDLHDLGPRHEDVLMAHTRMPCMVSRSGIPGSDEFKEALLNGLSANLNTALGVVKVVTITPIDDQTVALEFQQGSGPKLTINVGYADLNNYVFEPETQLFIIAGSVKKQFPTYVHDFPTTVLTQARKDEIVAYVLAMQPWI
jgi:hypothetical protein